jgi:hypothetical protein
MVSEQRERSEFHGLGLREISSEAETILPARASPLTFFNDPRLRMSKRDEYLKQAEQCRSAARQMSLTLHREQLIAIAENWERLATEADEPGEETENAASAPERPQNYSSD